MTYATNEWYIFGEGTLDKKTCNKIKRLGQGKWEPSTVDVSPSISNEERKTGREPDYKVDPQIRVSDVVWVKPQWLYDIVFPFMNEANDGAGWRFHIKSAESMQITRYKKGGYYNFHKDGRSDYLSAYDEPENLFLHNHVRKLSMTVVLNDNFEGGAFEFASYGKEKCVITHITPEMGSIIVFPSSMEHRVAPVTKGIRYSLVVWFLGPPLV